MRANAAEQQQAVEQTLHELDTRSDRVLEAAECVVQWR